MNMAINFLIPPAIIALFYYEIWRPIFRYKSLRRELGPKVSGFSGRYYFALSDIDKEYIYGHKFISSNHPEPHLNQSDIIVLGSDSKKMEDISSKRHDTVYPELNNLYYDIRFFKSFRSKITIVVLFEFILISLLVFGNIYVNQSPQSMLQINKVVGQQQKISGSAVFSQNKTESQAPHGTSSETNISPVINASGSASPVQVTINISDKDDEVNSKDTSKTGLGLSQVDVGAMNIPLRPLEPLETGLHFSKVSGNFYGFEDGLNIASEIDIKRNYIRLQSEKNNDDYEIQKIDNNVFLVGYISEEMYARLGLIGAEGMNVILFSEPWGTFKKKVRILLSSIEKIEYRRINHKENTIGILDLTAKKIVPHS